MTLLLTAAEAIWLIPFVCGLIFLAAVAVERVARWLAPDPDIAAAVERARAGELIYEGDDERDWYTRSLNGDY